MSDDIEWKNFKISFNKSYKNTAEDFRRFEIFKKNLKFVRFHNRNALATFSVELTREADLADEELSESRPNTQR